MNDEAKPIPSSRRQFLSLSMRGLIVLVLVIGAGTGWFIRSARIQRDAVVAIKKAGGSVNYNWEWSNGKAIPGGKPWMPKRLVELLGVDYLGHVTRVSYMQRASDLMNARMAETQARLAEIKAELAASEAKLDKALGRADGETVNPVQPPKPVASTVSNDGDVFTADLLALPQLSCVDLSFSDVTDDGLAHLKMVTSLSELNLTRTVITDAGLAHLKGLTNLTHLQLGEHSSSAGLVLRNLGTDIKPITDAGLAHVAGLSNLAHLEVCETEITAAGLIHLKGLTNLSVLVLIATPLRASSTEGIEKALQT
jgi:internalin A